MPRGLKDEDKLAEKMKEMLIRVKEGAEMLELEDKVKDIFKNSFVAIFSQTIMQPSAAISYTIFGRAEMMKAFL